MSGALLIVDDDADDVELLLMGLRGRGFESRVVVARDGIEAFELLRSAFEAGTPPAVVLTDLKMPRMDGIELLRRIKGDALTRGVPVAILTSSGREADQREALRLGASRYLRKPRDLDGYAEIADAVAELMAGVPRP